MKNAVEVEAADNGITADAVITINGGKATLTGVSPASLSKTEVSLKSSGWTNGAKYTYSSSNLKWTHSGTTVNTKDPKRDMADVFTSSAAPVTP